MTNEEIETIALKALQPREHSWRFWLGLLRGKPGISEHELLEYKPHIDIICEPLFGRRVEGTGGTVLVQLPLKQRIGIYLHALDVVREFRQISDLMRLAVFRRQVTSRAGLEAVDKPLFELIVRELPRLTRQQLDDLPLRMPSGSAIERALRELCRAQDMPLAAD